MSKRITHLTCTVVLELPNQLRNLFGAKVEVQVSATVLRGRHVSKDYITRVEVSATSENPCTPSFIALLKTGNTEATALWLQIADKAYREFDDALEVREHIIPMHRKRNPLPRVKYESIRMVG